MTEENKSGYKEEYCNAIREFFSAVSPGVEYKETFYSDGELKSREPVTITPILPTFELFAAKLGVSTTELTKWELEHESFARACDVARSVQLGMLKAYGLLKQYDASLVKFLLAGEYGMEQKTSEKPCVEIFIPPDIEKECN